MNAYKDINLTPSEALQVYKEQYPETTVKEVELELKTQAYVYKVEGYDDEKEYKIYIDPNSGEIQETKEKRAKRIAKEITQEHTDKIQTIVNKALKDGNGTLYEWSLELKDGRLELTVKTDLENGQYANYKYALDTGELLKKK